MKTHLYPSINEDKMSMTSSSVQMGTSIILRSAVILFEWVPEQITEQMEKASMTWLSDLIITLSRQHMDFVCTKEFYSVNLFAHKFRDVLHLVLCYLQYLYFILIESFLSMD